MKSALILSLFTLFTPSAFASDLLQSKISDVTLLRSEQKAVLLSPAENTLIANEIGFSRKASLYKAITSRGDLSALAKKFPEAKFPHTADLLKTLGTLEEAPVRTAESK